MNPDRNLTETCHALGMSEATEQNGRPEGPENRDGSEKILRPNIGAFFPAVRDDQ
jgi:hypothetical protein